MLSNLDVDKNIVTDGTVILLLYPDGSCWNSRFVLKYPLQDLTTPARKILKGTSSSTQVQVHDSWRYLQVRAVTATLDLLYGAVQGVSTAGRVSHLRIAMQLNE